MLKKLAAVAALVTGAAVANAAISTSAALANPQPFGLPAGSVAWDINITVSGGDDWTSTSAESTGLSGGTILDPNPAFDFLLNGVNNADSWVDGPGAGPVSIIGDIVFGPDSISNGAGGRATWFDTTNDGDGGYTIMRVILSSSSTVVTICGDHTTRLGGSTLFPYCVTLPEPSTLALIALGGLAGLIRRR